MHAMTQTHFYWLSLNIIQLYSSYTVIIITIISQVTTKGYFSLKFVDMADYNPKLFPSPTGPNYIVAPFWSDIDIRDDGEIYYQVHSRGSNTVSDELLHEVSVFISYSQQAVFSGSWMLVATWDQVKAFPGNSANASCLLH